MRKAYVLLLAFLFLTSIVFFSFKSFNQAPSSSRKPYFDTPEVIDLSCILPLPARPFFLHTPSNVFIGLDKGSVYRFASSTCNASSDDPLIREILSYPPMNTSFFQHACEENSVTYLFASVPLTSLARLADWLNETLHNQSVSFSLEYTRAYPPYFNRRSDVPQRGEYVRLDLSSFNETLWFGLILTGEEKGFLRVNREPLGTLPSIWEG